MSQARIIVADDDAPLRDSISEALASAGHEVARAHDGPSAAAHAERRVDLVVTDLWMPGMNGIELLAHVRASQPGVNGILVSGLATDDLVARAVKNGAVGAFAKPFHPDDLVEAVARALLRPELVVVAPDATELVRLATCLASFGRVNAVTTLADARTLLRERSIDLVVAHVADASPDERRATIALGARTLLLEGRELPSETELLARAARARAARIRG